MTIRKQLKAINGQRLRFMATVDRFGEKSAFRGAPMPTILLKDVRIAETKQVVTEHLGVVAQIRELSRSLVI